MTSLSTGYASASDGRRSRPPIKRRRLRRRRVLALNGGMMLVVGLGFAPAGAQALEAPAYGRGPKLVEGGSGAPGAWLAISRGRLWWCPRAALNCFRPGPPPLPGLRAAGFVTPWELAALDDSGRILRWKVGSDSWAPWPRENALPTLERPSARGCARSGALPELDLRTGRWTFRAAPCPPSSRRCPLAPTTRGWELGLSWELARSERRASDDPPEGPGAVQLDRVVQTWVGLKVAFDPGKARRRALLASPRPRSRAGTQARPSLEHPPSWTEHEARALRAFAEPEPFVCPQVMGRTPR